MPHPKRKISRTRRDTRRNHHKLEPVPYYLDPENGEATQYHRVNLNTGYYRGRQVMEGKNEE
ncbi:MAG: 50S ribosomal protein L32 [Bacteroidetes bacterium]|jgi:large subunit ribosomal protein L32|nr:MAG: 50S ribosomal protein L32 [Bacteroidota bacterium]